MNRDKNTDTIPVKLLADYWPSEDERIAAGSTIQVPLQDALALLQDGKAQRADPMTAA